VSQGFSENEGHCKRETPARKVRLLRAALVNANLGIQSVTLLLKRGHVLEGLKPAASERLRGNDERKGSSIDERKGSVPHRQR
jgi:hypothetical protein